MWVFALWKKKEVIYLKGTHGATFWSPVFYFLHFQKKKKKHTIIAPKKVLVVCPLMSCLLNVSEWSVTDSCGYIAITR